MTYKKSQENNHLIHKKKVFNITAWPGRKLDIHKDSANYTCVSSSNSVGQGAKSFTSFRVECKYLICSKCLVYRSNNSLSLFFQTLLRMCLLYHMAIQSGKEKSHQHSIVLPMHIQVPLRCCLRNFHFIINFIFETHVNYSPNNHMEAS